jgi:syntaxin 16
LEVLHKKHLLPGFTDKASEEREIRDTTDGITRAFQDCQKKIKQCQQHASNASAKQSQTISKNIQISLATKLQELSNSFRKSQSDYLSSCVYLYAMFILKQRTHTQSICIRNARQER